MLIQAYSHVPSHISRTSARSLSPRSLSDVIKGKPKVLTAKPKPAFICAACQKSKHTLCVSDRCVCGRKHFQK
jgi:hypothetical protein